MNKIKNFLCKYKQTILAVFIIFIISILLALFINLKFDTSYRFKRAIFFFLVGLFFYMIRPHSIIHKISIEKMKNSHKILCAIFTILIIIVVISPMTLNDVWGKPGWGHHTQYEDLTESLLNGHLYFDQYTPNPKLAEMENPYDYDLRKELNFSYRWDHAYYEGKYYMYFGIVPVIVLFAPLKLIGITLSGPQATQIFSVFAILGIFQLFYQIGKKFAPKMTIATYVSISCAITGLSLWYAINYPALYCTAITSGICFAIWGFYFCFKAFCLNITSNKIIINAFLGALFSSLVFGCRPTIGFISLSYIPMILYFLNKSITPCDGNFKENFKNWIKQIFIPENIKIFIAFCLPYIIVAILLMSYNYARFENPFEFGQTYQLTGINQYKYFLENNLTFDKIFNSLCFYFLRYENLRTTFPYITHYGVFINFPILLLLFHNFNLFNRKTQKNSNNIKFLNLSLILIVIIICLSHISWASILLTRYTLDFNFILGILLMFSICKIINEAEENDISKISFKLTLFATTTVLTCFLLFFVAFDLSIVEVNPNILPTITKFLMIK